MADVGAGRMKGTWRYIFFYVIISSLVRCLHTGYVMIALHALGMGVSSDRSITGVTNEVKPQSCTCIAAFTISTLIAGSRFTGGQ